METKVWGHSRVGDAERPTTAAVRAVALRLSCPVCGPRIGSARRSLAAFADPCRRDGGRAPRVASEPIDPTDGRLDLLGVGGRNLFAVARGAADLLLRTGALDGSVIRRPARFVRIESEPPQPVQTDGDAHAPGWLEATIRPGALHVVVPAS